MTALASALPAHPGWMQNLQYQLAGFLVVICALGAIAVLVWGAGKLFAAGEKPGKTLPSPDRADDDDGIPGPVLAAISAAVSVALEGRHFVVYGVTQAGSGAWSAEGRRAIYRSHQIR